MRAGLSVLFVLLLTQVASAACFGTGAYRSCYDTSGNSYSITDFGNTTIMRGQNSRTGSTWSQNSTTYGNTTFNRGTTNGQSWHSTQQTYGGITTYNGVDSSGNSFSETCTAYGCY